MRQSHWRIRRPWENPVVGHEKKIYILLSSTQYKLMILEWENCPVKGCIWWKTLILSRSFCPASICIHFLRLNGIKRSTKVFWRWLPNHMVTVDLLPSSSAMFCTKSHLLNLIINYEDVCVLTLPWLLLSNSQILTPGNIYLKRHLQVEVMEYIQC